MWEQINIAFREDLRPVTKLLLARGVCYYPRYFDTIESGILPIIDVLPLLIYHTNSGWIHGFLVSVLRMVIVLDPEIHNLA